MPVEVHQCYQAGVNGPTTNAQKQLSFQKAGTEGCCDLPDSNTSAMVPISASSSNECRNYHLMKKKMCSDSCDPVLQPFLMQDNHWFSKVGFALLCYFKNIFQDASREGAWVPHFLYRNLHFHH